jgi:predicted enzyme related to lactoylglutathione lyase
MSNAAVWFEIYVQDMPRARKFYETVLQKKLSELKSPAGELEMWAFESDQSSYGTSGALVKMAGVPSGGCSTIVYFSCKDCAVEEARVVPAGGKVHKSKMSIGQHGFISLVVDSEGTMFGLHSM